MTARSEQVDRVAEASLPLAVDFSLLWFNETPLPGGNGAVTIAWMKFYDESGASTQLWGPWTVDITTETTRVPSVVFDAALPEGEVVSVAVAFGAVSTSDPLGVHTWTCAGDCTVNVPVSARIANKQANGVVLTLDVAASFADTAGQVFVPDFVTWPEMVETRSVLFHDQFVRSESPLGNDYTGVHAIAYDGASAIRAHLRGLDVEDCDVELWFEDETAATNAAISLTEWIANDGWTPWFDGSNILIRVNSKAPCVAAGTCEADAPSACDGYELDAVEAEFLYFTGRFRGLARGELKTWGHGSMGLLVEGDVRALDDTSWSGWTPALTLAGSKPTETDLSGRLSMVEVGASACNAEEELIEHLTDWVCVPDTIFARPVARDIEVEAWTGRRGGCAIDFVDGVVGFEGVLPGMRVVGRGGCQRTYRGARADPPSDVPDWTRAPTSPLCAYETGSVVGPECSIAYAEAFDPSTGAVRDTDCDGLGDFIERCIMRTCYDGTCDFPHNRGSHDTDGDGWWDSWEICDPAPTGAPLDAIRVDWFTSPRVRDGLIEVVYETPWTEANVMGVVARAASYGTTAPTDPPPTWEPFVLSAVDFVDAGSIAPNTSREITRTNWAAQSVATNNMVRLAWFTDTPGTSSASGGAILMQTTLTDPTTSDVLVHEYGHTLGLDHGGVRIDGDGSHTFESGRTFSSVYRSVMSYADRMDAHEMPSFSPGARSTVDENAVTEVGFAFSRFRSEWFQSGFDVDHAAFLTAPTIAISSGLPVAAADCTQPGFGCPDSYSCVYEAPGWPEYALAAAERPDGQPGPNRPRVGECRWVTAAHDWDDDGALDLTLEHTLPGVTPVPGWNIDTDCRFVWDNFSEGKWLLSEHGGTCDPGSDTTLPVTSPSEFELPFGLCANDGDGRSEFAAIRGASSVTLDGTAYDRLEYDANADGVLDICVWIPDNADFWDDRVHEDINDFDQMWFPNGGYGVPACRGVLKAEPPALQPAYVDRTVDSECDFVVR